MKDPVLVMVKAAQALQAAQIGMESFQAIAAMGEDATEADLESHIMANDQRIQDNIDNNQG